jgi:hypothetical protein
MPKTLKVIFTGVCTFAPSAPDDPNETLTDFFVLMPAARAPQLVPQKDQDGKPVKPLIIARHQSYLYVPDQLLGMVPEPAILIRDQSLGLCNVYLMDRARITFDRIPANPLRYFVDPQERPVTDRPDEDNLDIAPHNDSRWVADSTEILPGGARLRADVNPANDITNGLVSMVVHLKGGLIEAGDVCNTAQARTFAPVQVPIAARVLVPELTVTMEFPDDTLSINLVVSPLDPNELVSGLDGGLELFWRSSDTIQLRIGNDTLDEIVALRDDRRCEPGDDLPELEAEFGLQYGLMEIPPGTDLPLPKRGGQQGDVGGCVGVKVKYP